MAAKEKTADRGRTWAFRLLAAVIFPVLLLLLAEGVTRVFTSFPSADFFIEEERDGKVWVHDNQYFGYTFFHPRQARSPAQNLFTREKTPGTIRVLVLGESAAMGFPRPEFGLARTLKSMLEAHYPDHSFDVIDGSMTTINMLIVSEIAREAMNYKPDVIVLYAGNNEALGPYGPVAIFGPFYPARWLMLTDRWLRTHSSFVRQLSHWWNESKRQERTVWEGLDHFGASPIAHDDPRLDRMRRYMRLNLRGLLDEAATRGIPVVAATTAVNLDQWPPLYTYEPDHLTGQDRLDLIDSLSSAENLMEKKDWTNALERLRFVERLAPAHAQTLYDIGECLTRLGDRESGFDFYERAALCDGYRFRADQAIADIIREEVLRKSDSDAVLIDARRKIYNSETAEPIFLEHVHFTVPGMMKLAALFKDAVVQVLDDNLGAPAKTDVETSDIASRLFYLPDVDEEAWAATGQFLQMDVFRKQKGYANRLKDVEKRRLDATDSLQQIDEDELHRQYGQLPIPENDRWHFGALYGRYLVRRGLYDDAVRALADAIRIKPNNANLLELLGYSQYRIGALPEATRSLEKALDLNPYIPDAWNTLGLVWYLRGSREKAQDCYEEALSLDQAHAGALNNLGYLYYEKRLYTKAAEFFRKALSRSPGMIEARYHLGLVLINLQQLKEASDAMQAVLKVNPQLAKAWNALGLIRMEQGKVGEAERFFERALREEPDLTEARVNLGYAWINSERAALAVPLFAELIDQEPDAPEIHFMYGMALFRSGNLKLGIQHLRRAIEAAPHRSDWMLETARRIVEDPAAIKSYRKEAEQLTKEVVARSGNRNQEALLLLEKIESNSGVSF